MTEAELAKLEYDFEHVGPLSVGNVHKLFGEVRAAWNAVWDMRQESDAYCQAIIDVVRVIQSIGEKETFPAKHDYPQYAKSWASVVADLTLTREEFDRIWANESRVEK